MRDLTAILRVDSTKLGSAGLVLRAGTRGIDAHQEAALADVALHICNLLSAAQHRADADTAARVHA